MKERMYRFQEKMNEALTRNQRLCFMTRAMELQEQACDELRSLLEEASSVKAKAVEAKDENAANAVLAYENVIGALIAELQMWISLKQDAPFPAWNYLIDSQMAALHAVRAHPVAEHMAKYLERLEAIESLLFPPQVFMSAGLTFGDAECSICGNRYGECDHIKSRAYMGQFCQRILKDITFTEISMVDDPVDKRCIVTSYSADGKTMIDRMTLRPIASETNADVGRNAPVALDDEIHQDEEYGNEKSQDG